MQQPDSQILHFLNNCYIKDEEVQPFMFAWEALMSRFNISPIHHKPFLEIVSDTFELIDRDTLYIYELNSAIDAIDFLIEYSERFDKLAKEKSIPNLDNLAKVRVELNQREIEFKYPSAAQVIVKSLYHYLRNNDNFLHSEFFTAEALPSTDFLKTVRQRLGDKLKYGNQYYVIRLSKDLQTYIEEHLKAPLSRKVNLFIFEILYLFNLLRYAGKVKKRNCEEFSLNDKTGTDKYASYIGLTGNEKSQLVTAIVANANAADKARQ